MARRHYFEDYIGRRKVGQSLANCTAAISEEPMPSDSTTIAWTQASVAGNRQFWAHEHNVPRSYSCMRFSGPTDCWNIEGWTAATTGIESEEVRSDISYVLHKP